MSAREEYYPCWHRPAPFDRVREREIRDNEVLVRLEGAVDVAGDLLYIAAFMHGDVDEDQIMCGIQFIEALMGDQLLPTRAYMDLLSRHGFRNIGAFDLTPVHAVIYGQK